jgi:hypothetical protein
LTSLKLNISETNNMDEGAAKLGEGLSKLHNLIILDLDLE